MPTVQNLHKVSLLIQAGSSPENMDIQADPAPLEFIFGVATQGMTPFEYELLDRDAGEELLIRLKKDTHDEFFDHLRLPLTGLFDNRDEAWLRVRVAGVEPADNRSILKAMAEAATHGGGGCDCGCGCG